MVRSTNTMGDEAEADSKRAFFKDKKHKAALVRTALYIY